MFVDVKNYCVNTVVFLLVVIFIACEQFVFVFDCVVNYELFI